MRFISSFNKFIWCPWTADYVTVTGDLVADLLSNIASEQRAKVIYEYLYRQIDDKYVRETIDFEQRM